jgi:hypothetical protein
MYQVTLTPEQEIGVSFRAAHNQREVNAYVQWRVEQDADAGYAEYLAAEFVRGANAETAQLEAAGVPNEEPLEGEG